MNPNTPDTPLDTNSISPEPTNLPATSAAPSVGSENQVNIAPSSIGDNSQEIASSESIVGEESPTTISDASSTINTLPPSETIQDSIVVENNPQMDAIPVNTETLNTSAPDTPKKGRGVLIGALGILGLTLLGSIGFAGYAYYERVTHPDWTASEIGVFIRDGVIDSLKSHAMTLSGSEPTFTTINTTYTLSGEGKGLETVGFKNANAALNMSGSAYMEPMTTSGSLPIFDGNFTMKFSMEGSGDAGIKGSISVGLDAKSAGGDVIYVRPNHIKLIAPGISEQFGREDNLKEVENTVDELNETYLGKWYRLNTGSYPMDMIDVLNEIDPTIYSLNMKGSVLEIMEQQQADAKKLDDHLKKIGAIFNKYHILTGEAHAKSWKSYFKSEPITYTASINKEETKKFLKEFSKWISEVPVNSLYGPTLGEMSNLFGISNSDELINNLINNLDLSMTLVSDSKKQGSIQLNQLDMKIGQEKDRITLHLQDLLQTKVERNDDIMTVHRNGSICGIQITQSGSRKGICEADELKDSIMFNAVYSGNTELLPKKLSFSGDIDVFSYDHEKKNFNEKAAHININLHLITADNTTTKFSQKINLNAEANIERANTKVEFSLDGSQVTEKVTKRIIDPVSESIDIMTTLKNFLIWAKTMDEQQKSRSSDAYEFDSIGDHMDIAKDSGIQKRQENILNTECAELPNQLSSCMKYQCKFTHPFTDEEMERKVVGMNNGKCSYVESMPNNGKMECNYTEDQRNLAAQFYNNTLTSGVNPLQTFMNDGTCVVSGY